MPVIYSIFITKTTDLSLIPVVQSSLNSKANFVPSGEILKLVMKYPNPSVS